MKPYILILGFILIFASGVVIAADESLENEPIQPVEIPSGLDPAKVKLGKKLFNDTRLSKNDTLSCASCHQISQGGAVNLVHAPPGVSGKSVPLNVPTFFGSGLNFLQFWDGRAASLEKQMDGPIANIDEMGTSWPEIIKKLKKDPKYIAAFQKIYNAPPDAEKVRDAIAAFERAQVPTDSLFDRFLKGEKTAISAKAKKGYVLFKDLGCAACHQGQNVGGNMLQKFGIIEDYFVVRGNVSEKDYGRYNVTRVEEDRYVFKVPSLRNVDQTPPYFHDGSAKTLEEAVDAMAKYQLGRTLSKEERDQLVSFLKTLTGKLPPSSDEDNDE